MERRPGEQRLKLPQTQGRSPHEHGHGRAARLRLHRPRRHLDDPLPLHGQGPPRRQVDPLHQHHRQTGQGLRQKVPRVHEGGEAKRLFAHRQRDGAQAPPLVPPVDEIPDPPDQRRQQAQPVHRRPKGHRAKEHPAGPRLTHGQQQHPAPHEQRRGEEGQKRTQSLPPAHQQRRHQQTPHPSRQAQQPRPPAQRQRVPHRSQKRQEQGPPGLHPHPAQGPGQPQQQQIHPRVVQQKPLQGDPHATSTTMTVMSSRCPFSWAAAISDSAICSRGAS